jgi:hypothetical protein
MSCFAATIVATVITRNWWVFFGGIAGTMCVARLIISWTDDEERG